MELKVLCVLLFVGLGGCLGTSAPESETAEPGMLEAPDDYNQTKTWNLAVNLTTRGASEMGGYYYHPGVPPIDGFYEPTDFNCIRMVVRGARLLNLTAVATWSESGPEENLLLYHFLKESDGPFRGAENVRGVSPLAHNSNFAGRATSTEWLTVGVHPATGLPYWYGMVNPVNVNVTIAYQGETPTVDALVWCSPQHKQLV